MKKSFHVFFLFVLFAFFAVNAARAAAICPEPLQEGSDGCFVNMPVTGTSTVNITADDIANGWTTFKVYDDGGKDENYSWNAEGYLTLNVPQGYVLQVGGVPMAYGVGERLKIFDGSSEGQVLFNEEVSSYTGNIGTYISTGNLLTLYFAASGLAEEYVLSGLDLTVKVIKMNLDLVADGEGDYYVNMLAQHTATLNITADDIENGITSFNVYDDGGKDGDYSWNANGCLVLTAPEGYMFQVEGDVRLLEGSVYYGKFTIYDGNSGNQELLDVSSNDLNIGKIISTANIVTLCLKSFARLDAPYSRAGLDLIVKVVKTNLDLVADGEGGYYVNMLSKRSAALTITTDDIGKGITSFNVYDDGGKDGEFSYDANDYLTITAPKGYVLQVTGDVYSRYGYSTGWLTVYDGNSKATQLQEESTNARVNVTSTDNVVTLYFKSTATSQNYTCEGGLDLLVTLLQSHIITINDVDGGSVTTDKEKATQGETVTLTISPDLNDYELTNLVVTYGTNNSTVNISVSENNTSATFTMPDGDVTVTPAWKKKHSVTVTEVTGGSVTTDKEKATQGELVTLTITPASDYLFDKLEVTYGANNSTVNISVSENNTSATFTMPDGDVTVTPAWKKKHSVTVTEVTGGSVTTDKEKATQGELVTLTITPASDYLFDKLEVTYGANNSTVNISVSENNTSATFTMPDGDVTVTPAWKKKHSVTVTEVTGGSVTTDKEKATQGELVTLTITPASDYLFDKLEVTYGANNSTVNISVSENNTSATFTMPDGDVTVTPSWKALLIEDGESGYYVNMPVSGTKILDLAEYVANGVTSFKVYDDGGKDGNFTNIVDGYLVLTAPAGYQLLIQGSMKTFCSTSDNCSKGEFVVYDGNVGATEALHKWGNVSNINAYSSGNTMTLYFGFGAAGFNWDTDSGLDFTVSVITQHSVNIADVSGGKISTNKETADEGTTVTLTAAPDKGYILNSISVVGLDGKSVEINNGTWRIGVNTITFSMPKEAVFVSPLFIPANEFSIPKEGRVEVVIPEGVESFNVYDDGGKDGNYSNAADGKLQLTAPENYVFQVSGSATTEVAKDLLTIYDGAIDSDKKLLDEKSGSIDLNGANVLTSTNNIITIKFYSNGITNKSGFDLKVTLVKPTYGAVSIAKADDGKIHATINGDYEGTETLSIPEAIEVDAIDYNREIDVESPVTALLPVTLPAGTTVNADFYTLEKVEQVEGMKWQATMTYIGKNNLPQPNTPYAVILPKGQTKLEFDLKGNKATVQTGKIKKVCGLSDCTLDENGQITDDWFFTGTYAYKQWNAGDEELGLAYAFAASDNPDGAAKGKFGKIKAGAFANATRCYLRKRDAKVKLQQQNQAQMVAASPYVARYSINNLPETIDVEFVKNDEKGGRTVLRGRMNTVTGEFKMLRDYDLKGRKVNGVNKARGAYYGKKVLKK